MSGRSTTGWQTALADLSLILFMVTGAVASEHAKSKAKLPAAAGASRDTGQKTANPAPPPVLRAEPLAVYVDEPGAPPLAQWLAEQAPDPRQMLTVTAHYGTGSGAQARALAAAARIALAAGKAGVTARIVVEPGPDETRAVLAYDSGT